MPSWDASLGAIGFTAPGDFSAKMLVLTGPAEDSSPFRKNVVVSVEDVPESMDEAAYVNAQLSLLEKNMEGFERLRLDSIEIAGQKCTLMEMRSLGPGGALYGNLIAYVVSGKVAYTLSGSHLMGPRFEAAKAEYLELFRSFKVGR